MSITVAIVEDLDEVRDGLKNFLSLSKEFAVVDVYKTAEEVKLFLKPMRLLPNFHLLQRQLIPVLLYHHEQDLLNLMKQQ